MTGPGTRARPAFLFHKLRCFGKKVPSFEIAFIFTSTGCYAFRYLLRDGYAHFL